MGYLRFTQDLCEMIMEKVEIANRLATIRFGWAIDSLEYTKNNLQGYLEIMKDAASSEKAQPETIEKFENLKMEIAALIERHQCPPPPRG